MLYFAYGSNLCAARLVERAPSAVFVGVGRLANHELTFHKLGRDGTGKADVVEAEGGVVWGAVAEMDSADLLRLDGFEPGYERTELPIEGIGVDAWVYRASADVIRADLEPQAWYLDLVVRGAEARGLPSSYIAWLATHQAEASNRVHSVEC